MKTMTNLANGPAILQVPNKLTPEDVQDLRELLTLQLKSFERYAKNKTINDTIKEVSQKEYN